MLTIIDNQFDEIHKKYRRLKYDKLIPCNCSVCKLSQEPYFYNYARLRRFREDGQIEIQCQYSYQMVIVRSLIDDIKGLTPETDEDDVMTNQKRFTSGDITVGDNFSGTIITGEVKDSFNKIELSNASKDLKESLKQLIQEVDAMSKNLPQGTAMEVKDDLGKLIDEATKDTPRKKWYSVSIDGLIKAAENLGKIGEPVIDLSRKVLSLLTVGR